MGSSLSAPSEAREADGALPGALPGALLEGKRLTAAQLTELILSANMLGDNGPGDQFVGLFPKQWAAAGGARLSKKEVAGILAGLRFHLCDKKNLAMECVMDQDTGLLYVCATVRAAAARKGSTKGSTKDSTKGSNKGSNKTNIAQTQTGTKQQQCYKVQLTDVAQKQLVRKWHAEHGRKACN